MPRTDDTIITILRRLWRHFSRRRKVQFALLLVLMVGTAFAEVFSLGAVLPFLAVLTDPQGLYERQVIQPLIQLLRITSPEGMLLPLTIAFGGAAVLSGTMRLLQAWANTRVSFATGADLSVSIYQRTLYQPYSVHVSRNSSSIINAVSSKSSQVIFGGITPVITMITSVIILFSILFTLIVIHPVVALSAFAGFSATYGIVIVLTHKQLQHNGALIARESTAVVKSLQEGLGGIRDVLIDGNQNVYCDVYSRAVFPLRWADGNNQFINQSPRFGIEAIGMILIASLAYWLVGQPGGFAKAVPVLGTLAFGAQRMLPALQQVYGSWSTLQGNAASLTDVLELLEQPVPEYLNRVNETKIRFEKEIALRNLSFRYAPDASEVLSSIDLRIPKGSRVGFIGSTGSGKSTLLDIVMGLLSPTSGTLQVDNTVLTPQNQRAWQRHIAHVPQSIFLADSSIEENIAFGVPKEKIDHERVKLAAEQAQIAGVIESWPKQYQTFVGERGVRLSGGQRQRIGIARALYKQSDVIIFDEATSALDNQTEAAVMQAIEDLHEDLTVLIIAHRLTTLRNCDMIVELAKGKVKATGTYEEIVSSRNGSSQPAVSKTPTIC
jgi:ATP-binding cassette subfamily B protein